MFFVIIFNVKYFFIENVVIVVLLLSKQRGSIGDDSLNFIFFVFGGFMFKKGICVLVYVFLVLVVIWGVIGYLVMEVVCVL